VQGGGVGRRLLEAISERAPAEVRVVWLFTGAESDGNIRFYESAGFVRVSEHLDAVGIRCVTLEQKVV
jgi:ribosomal protein S18 acetylase RimI-like enzyme